MREGGERGLVYTVESRDVIAETQVEVDKMDSTIGNSVESCTDLVINGHNYGVTEVFCDPQSRTGGGIRPRGW